MGLRAGLEGNVRSLCWETSGLAPGLRELILKALDEPCYVWVVCGGDVGKSADVVVSEAADEGSSHHLRKEAILFLSYQHLIVRTPHLDHRINLRYHRLLFFFSAFGDLIVPAPTLGS